MINPLLMRHPTWKTRQVKASFGILKGPPSGQTHFDNVSRGSWKEAGVTSEISWHPVSIIHYSVPFR